MDKKQIVVILCLFGVFFSLLSVASASDMADDETLSVSIDEDQSTVEASNDDENILEDPSQSFSDLNDTIQDPLVPVGGGNKFRK